MTAPARTLKGMPTAGLYQLSRNEYDAHPGLNFSMLKELAKSPAHYQHRLTHPREDTGAMRLGRVGHLCTLEAHKLETEVAVWDGGERRGKEWLAFKAARSHQEIVKPDELDSAMAMAASIRSHPVAGKYVKGGTAEVAALWQLEGLQCKGRLDYVAPRAIVDVKTCRDASPEGFARAAFNGRLHVQAAWYSDGYKAATGEALPYVLVVVESEAPYAVMVYRVEEDVLEAGREEYRRHLNLLSICQQRNEWPSYSLTEVSLSLPRWAFNDFGPPPPSLE